MRKLSVVALVAIILAGGGCATGLIPGGAGEVSGPLRSIEFYTKAPKWEEPFRAPSRDRLFSSDGMLYVVAVWTPPSPGQHVSKVIVRTPDGAVYRDTEYTFESKGPYWPTSQTIDLPQEDAARSLAGRWQVEVALDGKPVGRRSFTFEPSNIRLRTYKRLVILRGMADATNAPGDWGWRNEYGLRESQEASLKALGVIMRDELSRRFPRVSGPQDAPAGITEMVILTPSLQISPNPSMEPRLELWVLHSPTKTARKFIFKTSAGVESGRIYFGVAAADLAVQAASSPEVLELLVSITQAVPE